MEGYKEKTKAAKAGAEVMNTFPSPESAAAWVICHLQSYGEPTIAIKSASEAIISCGTKAGALHLTLRLVGDRWLFDDWEYFDS